MLQSVEVMEKALKEQISPTELDWREVAALIDHTLLKPEATRAQVAKLCAEAVKYSFCSVMVNPSNVAQCVSLVKGSPVLVWYGDRISPGSDDWDRQDRGIG